MADLRESFGLVRSRIHDAAQSSGRKPEEVKLVAVSKSVDVDMVLRAHADCGQKLFAENRADELLRKTEACGDLSFHFVGPLQTNKVRKVVGAAELIHSVDSERLMRAIDARAQLQGIRQSVLLQVNVSGEEVKQGLDEAQLEELLEIANSELRHIQINGLMTMAPLAPAADIRWVFEGLRTLRDRSNRNGPSVSLKELSMGMTGDFEAAIEEGATLVRVGTALFAS